jgi:hypothetical protein
MATDTRLGLILPGLGVALSDDAAPTPLPTNDCADSPWTRSTGAPSYGEPTLDRLALTLDFVRQRLLEPLRKVEDLPQPTPPSSSASGSATTPTFAPPSSNSSPPTPDPPTHACC